MDGLQFSDYTLETVGPDNLEVCGIGCVGNRKHVGFQPKMNWLTERFSEGLRLLMFRDSSGKPLAFLEYVPGEFAWRPVSAGGWIFIHCLWVYPRAKGLRGLGGQLIRACIEEAKTLGASGVAALTSDGPWMAPKGVFLKAGFQVLDMRDRFELVGLRLKKGKPPCFGQLDPAWRLSKGLHIVYSEQCPYLPKSVADVSKEANSRGIEVRTTLLRSAAEAQVAPSYYGVYNMLWNGALLADHYVSTGRFRNILKQGLA